MNFFAGQRIIFSIDIFPETIDRFLYEKSDCIISVLFVIIIAFVRYGVGSRMQKKRNERTIIYQFPLF
jgi:hypothetical protein